MPDNDKSEKPEKPQPAPPAPEKDVVVKSGDDHDRKRSDKDQ